MKLIDTFYVRHQIPHGWTPEQAATIAAEDLHLAATRMGLKLRSEVKTRLITDGATPTVEAWAYIHPPCHHPAGTRVRQHGGVSPVASPATRRGMIQPDQGEI